MKSLHGVAAGVAVLVYFSLFPNCVIAQTSGDKDCEELKKEIVDLQQHVADLAASAQATKDALERLKKEHEKADKALQDWNNSEAIKKVLKSGLYAEEFKGELLDHKRNIVNVRSKIKNTIEQLTKSLEDLNRQIEEIKKVIDDLLNKLADCGKKKAADSPTPKPSNAPTEHALRTTTGNSLATLIHDGKVRIDSSGTGDTIGHIADLKLTNLTDQPINCVIPPMVMESKSRKNQDYVCPKTQTVKIDPHGTVTVPIDGICGNRNKPPVGKDVPGDLVVNTGDPTIPQSPDSHIPANQARDLLRICTAKYEAADKLQKDGALKDLPYKDKDEQKKIVEQWSTWTDPEISKITGNPPATKDDLKKVVYKQLETKGPMSSGTKKKVDQGIDTIFEKVELTTAKAKDLEKPAGSAEETAPAESSPPQ